MTRGIAFQVPTWAREHLKARKAVYFKAVKQAKEAQAALVTLEKKESNTAEAVDAATTNAQEEEVRAPTTAVVVEQEEKKEEHGKESKNEGNKVDNVDDANADDEDDADDDDIDGTSWYLDLGSRDFWPCYLRFMFIAAYKMIQSEWWDNEDATEPQLLSRGADSVALKPPKKLVLNTILRVCPPNTASIPPSSQTKKLQDLMAGFGLMMGLMGSHEEHGSLHLDMCNDDQEVISVLGAAGLGPLCDMCRDHHMFIEVLDTRRMCEVAALLNKLKPYFAFRAEDLAGTPFASASLSYTNLDEMKTMEKITETFSEIASLNCGVTGIVGV